MLASAVMFVFYCIIMLLYQICYVVYKSLGFLPAETRVGDGFSVNAVSYLLRAVLDVALYHKALEVALYLA